MEWDVGMIYVGPTRISSTSTGRLLDWAWLTRWSCRSSLWSTTIVDVLVWWGTSWSYPWSNWIAPSGSSGRWPRSSCSWWGRWHGCTWISGTPRTATYSPSSIYMSMSFWLYMIQQYHTPCDRIRSSSWCVGFWSLSGSLSSICSLIRCRLGRYFSYRQFISLFSIVLMMYSVS